MDKIEEVLTRGVANVLPDKKGLSKLISTKKIRVYLGIDPTGPRLHLGHTIPLRKLQEFADLGHEAILVFGTGTVLAGDPSQRKEARKTISTKEVEENIKTWKKQAEKVLNFEKIKIKYNGDWLLKLDIPKLVEIESQISATQLFKREMFQERLNHGDTVWYHETLYPVLQGYDSVHLDVDLEIGGTDQTFNMLIGRELQRKLNNREKFVLTTPLISGTDGKQMTKTAGNCIWLDDDPQEMYGKIMSMADNQIEEYWTILTELDQSDLKNLKPLDAKKKLAHEIVKIYYREKAARDAEKSFEETFQRGQTPTNIEEIEIKSGETLVDFVARVADSKSEAKRLIEQKAIEVDGEVVSNQKYDLKDGLVLKIGKRKFVRIVIR